MWKTMLCILVRKAASGRKTSDLVSAAAWYRYHTRETCLAREVTISRELYSIDHSEYMIRN